MGAVCAAPAMAAGSINGQVLGAGAPIANATVTLWAASAGAPKQLAQSQSGADGRFTISGAAGVSGDASLYLIAKGGTPSASRASGDNGAIALMTVLGSNPLASVTINEMTTVASVWTNAQFLEGSVLKGHALGLRIAAGNVPSFVDLTTGGWGSTIQDPLNSTRTTTMANFATLADVLAGCITRINANACASLFSASKGPAGNVPSDTLTAAQAIARNSWYHPERLFDLLAQFYPVPKDKTMRQVPFMPYLVFAPSAWVLPLKFDGGGYLAGARPRLTARGTSGSATISPWVGRDRTPCGREISASSRRMVTRSRRAFSAGDSPVARTVRR
jgi:hypothetical protein